MQIDPLYTLSGAVVGFVVGLTGVGGGSLMTPALVLLFSPPTTRWLAQDYAPDADDAA